MVSKLQNVFRYPDEESGFSIITHSQHYSLHRVRNKLKTVHGKFTILNLNALCLNEKYGTLVGLLDVIARQNLEFAAIFIQKTA